MQCDSSKRAHIRGPAIPRGPPRRSRTGVGKDLWPARSSLTLPKWYLATLNNYYKQTTLLDLHNSSYSTAPNNCNKEVDALDWLHWNVFFFLNDDDQEDFKFSKRILAFLLSASKPQSTYIREFKQQPRTPTATKTSLTKGIRAALNLIVLIPSPSIHKLPAIFLELNSQSYIEVQEKKNNVVVLCSASTKREIRHFHVVS